MAHQIRAEVRSIHLPDHEGGLQAFTPRDTEDFSVHVQLILGPEDGQGEESFEFELLTPRALSGRLESQKGPLTGRHLVFVRRYDPDVVEAWIRRWVGECRGNDWTEVGHKLSRWAFWEFEDYRECS